MGQIEPPDGQTIETLADGLAESLRSQGRLTDPAWERALREVRRDLFAPPRAWAKPDNSQAGGPIDRDTAPQEWWNAVYSDASLVIQADDGAGDPASGIGMITSSLSAPGVVIEFLELLAPNPGDRVLDVGTASGWTAALLSWRVGQAGVTSIEVDGQVAAQASANLKTAGFAPHLVVGDGTEGCAERAPFERIHVTAGVSAIPLSWVEQARPGGVIVMPWQPHGGLGHKLRLEVTSGSTAVGSFHGPAAYMMLRSQRHGSTWNPHHFEEADHSETTIDPTILATADQGADLVFAALAPQIGWHASIDEDTYSLLLFEPDNPNGSWAACDKESGTDTYQVAQYGERRLWDELSDAYLEWVAFGSPHYERFGLTVGPEGTHLWLDHPNGPSWKIPVSSSVLGDH
ncbi:protein-L-isoaspartate O-methyltransferase family protein [Nonomuraea basaltis]|uniref:protein-L-isoaspartate O-methyltransferase family protein n=1 Tax=Nonomuraea basaltis TaxID=2495887 RepID=UPI001F0D1223|nr:protein-L-isoaspartate(D-aspartate) O-methyltransferase [Nonomuraea basaltis]